MIVNSMKIALVRFAVGSAIALVTSSSPAVAGGLTNEQPVVISTNDSGKSIKDFTLFKKASELVEGTGRVVKKVVTGAKGTAKKIDEKTREVTGANPLGGSKVVTISVKDIIKWKNKSGQKSDSSPQPSVKLK